MSFAQFTGSTLWSMVNQARRSAADWGLVSMTRLDCPVISVGNIEAGGTGKTPLVIMIAQQAFENGYKKVAVLTRGYQSRWEKTGGVLEPEVSTPNIELCGDEAALIFYKVPELWVGVGADRAKQFRAVQNQCPGGLELVILDDGFQNIKIHRDRDIVAVTSSRFGQSWFRDFPFTLRRADIRVWTKGARSPFGNLDQQARERPMIRLHHHLQEIPAGKYWGVTGIAQPDFFYEDLKAMPGVEIAKRSDFPDHFAFAGEVVPRLIDESQNSQLRLLITEKDWIKWMSQSAAQGARSTGQLVVATSSFELSPADQNQWKEALWNSLA